MSRAAVSQMHVECAQCVVCEKSINDGVWFARIKQGGHTLLLCSQPCATRFYGRRLPLLRHIHLLAMLQTSRRSAGPYSSPKGR